jgi:hypothetical protein
VAISIATVLPPGSNLPAILKVEPVPMSRFEKTFRPARAGSRIRRSLICAAAVTIELLIVAVPAGGAPKASTGQTSALRWQTPPMSSSNPKPSAITASQFGADIVNFDYTGWGASAEGLWPPVSLGMVRIWDDETTWAALEPSPGVWNFSLLDQQVAQSVHEGSQVLYVLGQTPRWASSQPNSQDIYGQGAPAPPSNIQDWQQYVSAVATRYKGKISAYEVWDEADAATFSGTPQQMVQMATVAYKTIKQIDPSATVLTPSFTQNSLSDGWLSAYLAAGGGSVADAFAGHAYSSDPRGIRYYYVQYRAALEQAGVSLPIWMTEVGYSGFSSSGEALYTSSQAQAWAARTLLYLAEIGAARIIWYGANSNGMWLSLGEQGYPADAQAYTTMVNWLVGSTPKGCGSITTGPYAGLAGCYVTRPNGSVALMAYDVNGTTLTMQSPANETVEVENIDGSATVLAPSSSITFGSTPTLVTVASWTGTNLPTSDTIGPP